MASKNKVTLTFAGDSSQLERSFDRVGASAKKMGNDSEAGFKKVGAGAKAFVRSSKGIGNTLSGLQDTSAGLKQLASGDILGGLISLQSGLTDLAAGVGKFALSFASAAARTVAGWVTMGFQATVNAAKMAAAWVISLGPIALVIAAIAAIIAIGFLLIKNWDTVKAVAGKVWGFIKDAAASAFNWIKGHWPLILAIITGPIGLAVLAITKNWDKIKNGFSAAMRFVKEMASGAKTWVVNAFESIVSFFTRIPGRVRGVFASLGRSIVNGFKALWNNTIGGFGFTFGGFDPPGPGKIPGFSFRIPKLHSGGIMPGVPGSEGFALLQAGERVTPAGAVTGPIINVYVQGSVMSERQLVQVIRDEFRRGGFR